ncbi:28S rRNA (cytosine-C(5))-methyltransferase [Plutella xylostella]|uniref:28S rRNA (cytosine-C(5))-methyltransferase n=1 Tax=Plutella xylostella TaxID=51655 RepID=UPI0020323F51|nr:28S rRNA (cytosine-C(5))-methyltransferase [Plutella xylostella]
MFEHSVKVPRPYKIAANIYKKVATEGGSVKTLLYDNKLRHFRTNALFALITETIKHSSYIDKIFGKCNILVNEPRLDPWLARVLTSELLFGKKELPGKSKPEQLINSYKEQFESYKAEHQEDLKTSDVRRPRYVRINTNLLTTSDAVRAFQDEGYNFVRCTSGSYDDYLQQIQSLSEYDFTQDYHVKTVYVFPTGTKLHNHELYLENNIILQDKATSLAVHLLAPPQGSVVLDMCAAPGMKTSQVAAYMRNEGKVYAVERNETRYQTLCEFVEKTGCKCVTTMHKDALELKRGDFDDVEYILLDPSCSGSGMDFSVHNYIEPARLAKLTSLQEKFLKHAMNAFPKAKRIVYSTCSLYPEENERVVTNSVMVSRARWRVQDVKELLKGQWNNFGSNMYGSIGVRCLYAKPDSDLTTGFFLAVLDREPKDAERSQKNGDETNGENNEVDKKSLKRKSKKDDDGVDDVQNDVLENATQDGNERKKNKKKKNKISESNGDEYIAPAEQNGDTDIMAENNVEVEESKKRKKKKKVKREKEVTENVIDEETSTPVDTVNEEVVTKKKKKKKRNESETAEAEEINVVAEVDNEIQNKKKKKRSKDDLLDENVVANTDEAPKKKKKKHKRETTEVE